MANDGKADGKSLANAMVCDLCAKPLVTPEDLKESRPHFAGVDAFGKVRRAHRDCVLARPDDWEAIMRGWLRGAQQELPL